MARYRMLEPGDPAPWFKQRASNTASFSFDTVAGRYILLGLFGSSGDDAGAGMLSLVESERGLFDDDRLTFFGVSCDPADERSDRLPAAGRGVRYFWDFDGSVSRAYGSLPAEAEEKSAFRRQWVLLDPTLRLIAAVPVSAGGAERDGLARLLRSLPPVGAHPGFEVSAPVLVLPNVFEPDLCRRLIELYETHGGVESGFMREVDGRTVAMKDDNHKKRADYVVQDRELIAGLQRRILRKVVPEILKVHQFKVTRMERYIVSCYDSKDGGHFRAHRDNTTKGTAHRRFAVSINLNAEFEGGEIGFPEYGHRRLKPPPGGAVVFSCSLLHAVSPVTSGRRFAFLPFLYDDAAAAIREENNRFLGEGVGAYQKEEAAAS